jgi:hypothetical protein
MESIDIYAITAQAAESGAYMDQLAAQIRVERHVAAIDELGIPRFRITNGPVGVGMGDGTPSPPATSLPMTIGLAAGFDPDLAHAYGDIIGSSHHDRVGDEYRRRGRRRSRAGLARAANRGTISHTTCRGSRKLSSSPESPSR